MTYRQQLWDSQIDDNDDYSENIYFCAYLLSECAQLEDVFLLWEAKYLNMDVGCMLDANYMIGAGLTETLNYLQSSKHPQASTIYNYLAQYDYEDRADWVAACEYYRPIL